MSNIVYVDQPVVSCDGNGEGSGHPLIYLNLEESGEVVCPYCSRKFILDTN